MPASNFLRSTPLKENQSNNWRRVSMLIKVGRIEKCRETNFWTINSAVTAITSATYQEDVTLVT